MNNFIKIINKSLAIILLFYASVSIGFIFSFLIINITKQLFIYFISGFALSKNINLLELITTFLLLFGIYNLT